MLVFISKEKKISKEKTRRNAKLKEVNIKD